MFESLRPDQRIKGLAAPLSLSCFAAICRLPRSADGKAGFEPLPDVPTLAESGLAGFEVPGIDEPDTRDRQLTVGLVEVRHQGCAALIAPYDRRHDCIERGVVEVVFSVARGLR